MPFLFVCLRVSVPENKAKEKQQNQKPENVKTSYAVSEGVSLYSHFCRVALMSSTNSCCWQGSSTEMEAIPNVSVVTNLFPFCLSFKLNANWAMFQCCLNRQHASQHRAGKGVKIKVFTKVFPLPTWWIRWRHFFLVVSKDTGQFVDDKGNWEEN